MATDILMPQLSDTMDEGTILTWLKKEGDAVERGDELAEVGTDKADLPIESFDEGVLLKIVAPEGETVKVGEIIAVIGQAGEVANSGNGAGTSVEAPASRAPSTPEPTPESSPAPSSPSVAPSATTFGADRIKASPLAKKLAATQGVDLSNVKGTGEGGRITKKDVEAVSPASASSAPTAPVQVVEATPSTSSGLASSPAVQPKALSASSAPLSKMRQAIAARMVEATTSIPHFYLTTSVDATGLKKTRASLKTHPAYQGITFNHLIIRAAGLALAEHPRINAAFDNGNIKQPGEVNIGVVTALDDGLMIPVVKDVSAKSLSEVTEDAQALVSRARAGRPKSDDLLGATFCISNVGAFAVDDFTAVISPGNGAIMAVGAIQDAVVAENGAPVVKPTMKLTLSVDHRIIDGVHGAEFLTTLKGILEDPVLLLA